MEIAPSNLTGSVTALKGCHLYGFGDRPQGSLSGITASCIVRGSEENLKAYKEEYLRVNPGTPDHLKQATDERVVVGIGPKLHGRQAVLDDVCTPSISFTRLRATDPSLSQRTSTTSAQSHSLLAERHSVSIFPLIFLFAHFIFRI